MKKSLIYLFFVLFIVVAFVKSGLNDLQLGWVKFSKNISESKNRNVFLEEYEITYSELYDHVSDSLRNVLEPAIKDLTCWTEKQWATPPFLIFFHPQKLTGDTVLVLKQPKYLNEMLLYFNVNDRNSHRGAAHGCSIANMKSLVFLEKEIDLEFGFPTGEILGKITLSHSSNSNKKNSP